MLIGPMVARFGKAMISKPGGDKIGRRRLDTHFIGTRIWEPILLIRRAGNIRISAEGIERYIYVAR